MIDEQSVKQRRDVELQRFRSQLSLRHKMVRLVWGWFWLLLFRPSPRIAFAWRRCLLRIFGAKIAVGVRIYSSAKIYYPPNLILDENVVVAPDVDLYCVDTIHIKSNSMVSQYSYLCTASHDYSQPHLPLITAPICIEPQAWVCADVFIGPGVTVGEGAVVGARSTVTRNVESWTVVAGNPARLIRPRVMKRGDSESP